MKDERQTLAPPAMQQETFRALLNMTLATREFLSNVITEYEHLSPSNPNGLTLTVEASLAEFRRMKEDTDKVLLWLASFGELSLTYFDVPSAEHRPSDVDDPPTPDEESELLYGDFTRIG